MRPPLVVALLAMGLAPLVLLAVVLRLAFEAIAGVGDLQYLGPWSFGPLVGVALAVFAIPVAIVALALLDALHTLLCVIVSALLAPRTIPSGPVREMLAASLGDHSVTIAYWLPEREVFVDELGRPVHMPEPGSGMTWTAVERDGRRVAAIVHDAALDTSRELVTAAAAASSLAIDNERLKADLRARLEELRVSRLRIVEAADAARRRLERDLHDGAQQQLVGLALELRLLRRRVGDPELEALVDELGNRLNLALNELRELARGIHPAILTARGLAPAIGALADRVPVPVEVEIAVDERYPPAVEAAAYFLVAEALTNVAKYAQATLAQVELHRAGHELVVTVVDDGIGGADMEAGSGLRGLQDRLSAVDGTLAIESPPGGGTRLRATLPAGVEQAAVSA
jgi:signal transduction histidine kinase